MQYDYDMYYLREKSKFTVHFRNSAELSKEEIRNIFSKFGNVVVVSCSGDLRGLCFVSYVTLRETLNCIQNLKNHTKVKLLPEKSKLQKNTDAKNDKTDTDVSVGKSIHHGYRRNRNKRSSNTDNVVKNEQLNKVSRSWADESIKNNQQVFKVIENHDKQNDNEDSENYESSIKSFEMSSVSKNLDKFHHFDNLTTHSDPGSSSLKDNGCYVNDIPSLISAGASINSTSIESLNEISTSTGGTKKPKIVMAQHIVVANVHEDCSIHFILHLLHKYDPIASSLMKKIHGTGIRYCHVYFKNPQDALEVEQKFDNYVLNNKPLIVMRSD